MKFRAVKVTFLYVILCIPGVAKTSSWNWWNSSSANYELPDYGAVERLAEQEIEHVLQPHSQHQKDKYQLLRLKEIEKKKIRAEIERYSYSRQEAEEQAKYLARKFCRSYVKQAAYEKANSYLHSLGFGEGHVMRLSIMNKAMDEFESYMDYELQTTGRLSKTLRNGLSHVEAMIDAISRNLPAYQ